MGRALPNEFGNSPAKSAICGSPQRREISSISKTRSAFAEMPLPGGGLAPWASAAGMTGDQRPRQLAALVVRVASPANGLGMPVSSVLVPEDAAHPRALLFAVP